MQAAFLMLENRAGRYNEYVPIPIFYKYHWRPFADVDIFGLKTKENTKSNFIYNYLATQSALQIKITPQPLKG